MEKEISETNSGLIKNNFLRPSAGRGAEELAVGVQNGCEENFAELVKMFRRRLYGFLCGRVSNNEDAEDLVQDAFLRAYRNIEKYDSRWKFSTWLFTIADRLAKSHYRKAKKHEKLISDVRFKGTGPAERICEREFGDRIWEIARQLGGRQYEALWLKYCEGMSVREISKVLGKSEVNVKVILYRGRVNMGKKLAKENMVTESEGE